MNVSENLKSQISKKSWAIKSKFKETHQRTLNTRQIFDMISKPQDWNEIAYNCSVNPKHEHFGKTVEEIREIWSSKAKKGADTGMKLDRYIIAKLNGIQLDLKLFDESERLKCSNWDNVNNTMLSKLNLVGQELWMNSSLGLNMKLDALYLRPEAKEPNSLLIIDWKNNEKIRMSNSWNHFEGPLKGLENCDINKMSLQLHLYKFCLLELKNDHGLDISGEITSRIFQFPSGQPQIHKPTFLYDDGLIRETVAYAFEERERRELVNTKENDKS